MNIHDETLQNIYDDIYAVSPAADNNICNPVTFCLFHELSNPVSSTHRLADCLNQSNIFVLQKPLYEYIITSDIYPVIKSMYTAIYGDQLGTTHQAAIKSSKVSFYNCILFSKLCKSERGTCISAYWVPDDGTNSINTCPRRPHVGIINFFVENKIQLLLQLLRYT